MRLAELFEDISSSDKKDMHAFGMKVIEKKQIDDYGMYLVKIPGDEYLQVAFNRKNASFVWPRSQEVKFAGGLPPLEFVDVLKDWVKKYGGGKIAIASYHDNKIRVYEKVLKRAHIPFEPDLDRSVPHLVLR